MLYSADAGKLAFELMCSNHKNLTILGYDAYNCVANAYYRMMVPNQVAFSGDFMEDLKIRDRFHAQSLYLTEFVDSIISILENEDELDSLKKRDREKLETKLKNCIIDTLRFDIDDALNRWELTLKQKRKSAQDFDIPHIIIMMSQSIDES
jgi:hypothetical protein